MANLDGMIAAVIREGYSQANAAARVCQDIVLKAISKSSLRKASPISGTVCSVPSETEHTGNGWSVPDRPIGWVLPRRKQ